MPPCGESRTLRVLSSWDGSIRGILQSYNVIWIDTLKAGFSIKSMPIALKEEIVTVTVTQIVIVVIVCGCRGYVVKSLGKRNTSHAVMVKAWG